VLQLIEQGTPEWLSLRTGKVTGSVLKEAFAKGKNGNWLKSREDLIKRLATERRTNKPTESGFKSRAMMRGNEIEFAARARYAMEMAKGVKIIQVPFIDHPTIPMAGVSPDGLVCEAGIDNGALEIKCPNSATHDDWRLDGIIPEEHQYQCLWVLACTGREWIDFVSFDDRFEIYEEQFFCKRLYRNEEVIAQLEADVMELQEAIEQRVYACANCRRAA